MPAPDYLTYFFRRDQRLLRSICEHEQNTARLMLKQDMLWRAQIGYLDERIERERRMRAAFIDKGGFPVRKHPIYMILGDPPIGVNDLRMDYDFSVTIPLEVFDPEEISFSYPDSQFEVPPEDLGCIRLRRTNAPKIYRLDEIEAVIESYRVYEFNNHYVEAQVWNEAPARPFVGVERWMSCYTAMT
jgi:hypothetical protein